MKHYTIFDKNTGRIIRTGTCQDETFNKQTTEFSIIEGIYQDNQYYWMNNNFYPIPPKPGQHYYFDYTTKTWVQNTTILYDCNNGLRIQKLKETDYTQLPDVSIANKEEYATYRQQLRDMSYQDILDGKFPVEPN